MARKGAASSCSRRPARSTASRSKSPLRETHPTAPINAYGQTKLAIEQALPHFERAYGIRSIRLRYFNAAGADPDGELGEDHDPEVHVIPRAFEAATGGAAVRDLRRGLPDAGRHVPARLRARRPTWRTRTSGRWNVSRRGGASATYNVGTERPSSVREVIAAVERVTGRPVPRRSAPRRAGDPAVLYASAGADPRRSWDGCPSARRSTRSSAMRGGGIRRTRTGFQGRRGLMPGSRPNVLFRLLRVRAAASRAPDGGARRDDRCTAPPRPASPR